MGWVEPHCTGVEAGFRALSPAGLVSQALRRGNKKEVSGFRVNCLKHNLIVTDISSTRLKTLIFVPVTIKAHVSLELSAGRQLFRWTGLSLHFADRQSMKHHCKHTDRRDRHTNNHHTARIFNC